MPTNERLALYIFVIPELLVLFGVIWADVWCKTKWLKKQNNEAQKAPLWISFLFLLISLGISLFFNVLMDRFYFRENPSPYMHTAPIVNFLVVLVSMALVLFMLKPPQVK